MQKKDVSLDYFLEFGDASLNEKNLIKEIIRKYKFTITEEIAAGIIKEGAQSAIYKQFIPSTKEAKTQNYELIDPIGDEAFSPVKGLVHRYKDRVLLKLTTICAVYCRFCFRREVVGDAENGLLSENEIAACLEYVAQNPQIKEVILTGGDPLVISPRRLRELAQKLNQIPNVEILRVHTRIPYAEPSKITDELIDALLAFNGEVKMALHINHIQELSDNVIGAINKLSQSRIKLLSQSVLLKGVNDNPQMLASLMAAFVKLGIKPYYLHHPDLAVGTSHFQLNFEMGRKIYDEMAKILPPESLPKYVIDIPNGYGKVFVNDENIKKLCDGSYEIKDKDGRIHSYPKII